jgi:DNA-binding MarR family transcriptional regulator
MRLLWAVTHGLESTSKRMRLSLGVTGPQRLVLRIVGHYSTISPGELAKVMHVHPSSLTGVLRRLEHGRFIERERDPKDGRRAVLTLTEKGRRLNARTGGTVEAIVRRSLRAASAVQLEAAKDLLRKLADEFDAEEKSTKSSA